MDLTTPKHELVDLSLEIMSIIPDGKPSPAASWPLPAPSADLTSPICPVSRPWPCVAQLPLSLQLSPCTQVTLLLHGQIAASSPAPPVSPSMCVVLRVFVRAGSDAVLPCRSAHCRGSQHPGFLGSCSATSSVAQPGPTAALRWELGGPRVSLPGPFLWREAQNRCCSVTH